MRDRAVATPAMSRRERKVHKVVHLTTAHEAGDVRIFEKECSSLAAAGYEVTLIARGSVGGTSTVRHRTLPRPHGGRVARMTVTTSRALLSALKEGGHVYHFHDPELLPVGLVLRAFGKRVIYDAHEDVPKQILGKHYLPSRLRKPTSWAADIVERGAARLLSAVVTATPAIARRFPGRSNVVMNFPIVETFSGESIEYGSRDRTFAYVGAISIDRGLQTMVEATGAVEGSRLLLAGRFESERARSMLTTFSGHEQVDLLGWLDRASVARLLDRVRAGVVVLQPLKRYVESYPVKLFEYMAAGIPVIAADYPHWRAIVDGARCGILVQPTSEAVAEAMRQILSDPVEAAAMGARGAQAAREQYAWSGEAQKLVNLYDRLVTA